MTRDTPGDGDVTTEEAFDAALTRLLQTAVRNDIDSRGSWIIRNGDNAPEWGVVIVELGTE